jgi:endonuclease G, mitochondrial
MDSANYIYVCSSSAEVRRTYHRLEVELERSTRAAKDLTETISKEQKPSSSQARRLALQLIQVHNQSDAYGILRTSCYRIEACAKRLSLSNTLPNDKMLVVAMTNIIFSAYRLSVLELKDLCVFFQHRFGQKFTTWAANNGGNMADQRLVSKFVQPIEASLIDTYLYEIITPTLTNGVASAQRQSLSKPSRKTVPQTTAPSKPSPMTPSQPEKTTGTEIASSASISISKLAPTLPIRIIRPNPRLEIAFDVRTKNPVYSMERLEVHTRSGTVARPEFFEEERLTPEYRSQLCSFICSGYDRGHMAPAADFGSASVKDTFNLCNISPQNHDMNRSIWARLEHWCRQVAKKELLQGGSRKSCVYVITGPVWLPTSSRTADGRGPKLFEFEAIGKGDALIHVPTHFFKVISVLVGENRIEKFACFLVPNLRQRPKTDLEDYIVSWDRLEKITGLQFFPHIVDQKWKDESSKVISTLMKPVNGPDAALL